MKQTEEWDDGSIDEGIREAVRAFNKLPYVKTAQSCEGHGEHPWSYVLFFYPDGQVPPWAKRLLNATKRTKLCLGCLRVKLELDYHFDCSNTLMVAWWFAIEPRHDYGSDAKKDIAKAWKEIVKEIYK